MRKMIVRNLLMTVCVLTHLKCARAQNIPNNPCPSLFQYFIDNGRIYGTMEFPNDYTGRYTLSVNMSIATLLNDDQNIRLELRSSASEIQQGENLRYFVHFPVQNIIPKPTQIEFNQKIYCSGPKEEVLPGRGVTNMWASTYYNVGSRVKRPTTTKPSIFFQIGASPDSISIPTVPSFFDIFTRGTTTSRPSTRPTTRRRQPETPVFESTTRTINTSRVTEPLFIATESNLDKNAQCGVGMIAQELVVNGEDVEDGQYPWMMAIMYRKNFDYRYRCTGSLVSNRHVITAAHCVQFFKAPLFPMEDLLLVLGKNNIRNWANGAVIRDAKDFKAHPDYQQNKGDADIAVITMDRKVEFQEFIKPVCLWQENEDLNRIVGLRGTVVGWGSDGSGKDFVAEAKKIVLPVVSQVACLRSDPGFSNITSQRTFCAGNRDGSGPCTGDSGAGFVMRRNGKWTLRGVVSTALGDASTCDLDNYFVFADVAKVRVWLSEVMV